MLSRPTPQAQVTVRVQSAHTKIGGTVYGSQFERQHEPKRFLELALGLIGHLCGAAVIFVAFFTIGWLVSFALHWLHSLHPFPEEIFRIITRIEVWVVYADAFLCAIVLLAGAWRFALELVEARA